LPDLVLFGRLAALPSLVGRPEIGAGSGGAATDFCRRWVRTRPQYQPEDLRDDTGNRL